MRALPIVTFEDGEKYYVDDRLMELRNVTNPHDAIRFRCREDLQEYISTLDIATFPKEK